MPEARSPLEPSRQRVVGVGPAPGLLDDLEALFSESSVDARRATHGALALEQIRYTLPDLLLIQHPLPDMSTHEFVQSARSLTTGRCTVVLFAEEARLNELAALEDSGEIVLRSDGPRDSLLATAKGFLRQDRRCQRSTMVRLGVSMGDSRLLRLAQTVNLSQRGMLVRTSEHFPLGSEVRFELLLEGDEEPIRGHATAVRYANPDREGLSGVGLRFEELEKDGDERLRSYLDSSQG